MENKTRYSLIGAGALLAGAAAIGIPNLYAQQAEEKAAAAPSVSVSTPAADQTGQAISDSGKPLLAGTWQVGQGSEAGYRVAEVLNGQDVIVTGRTSQVEGSFTVNEAGNTLTAAEFTVDVASISTDSDRRDSYFSSKTVDTSVHPTATLKVTEPVEFTVPTAGQAAQVEIAGELTLAGVTQPVTFTAEIAASATEAQIAASIPITFSDFGIEAPSLGFVAVEESGAIEVQLVATPAV